MKSGIFSILLLLIAGILAAEAFTPRPPIRPRPGKPINFPGTPPFNPKPPSGPWGRFRRSPNNNGQNGQVTIHAQKNGGKTSWEVQGQKNIWENKHGSVWVNGGASKQPGFKTQGQVGIGGSFRFRRSPDNKGKNGQVTINAQKNGGKTSWEVQGQKNIWENKHGSVWVNGGASKQPGFKTQGQVGIGGSFRFRRSPDNKGKSGQVTINAQKNGGKTSWEVQGQKNIWQNKHGSVWVSGGANKQPGFKTQGQVGIGGSFRFRRSPDNKGKNGQVTINAQKNGGKTSWEVQGQKNIWQNKHGSVWVNGGASKQPGFKTQGQVGIGGSFRF